MLTNPATQQWLCLGVGESTPFYDHFSTPRQLLAGATLWGQRLLVAFIVVCVG